MIKNSFKNQEFISIINHEIKNSLNPVINLSVLMLKHRDSKLTPEEREYLEVIERNGRKILSLVDNVSYLYRLREYKSKTLIDIDEFVEKIKRWIS